MRKFIRNLFPILIMTFLLSCIIYSRITAQQSNWVTYHGDFCAFSIRNDYQLDYKKSGNTFTYTIYNPQDKEKKLIISSGHKKMKFRLPDKNGYITQYSGVVKTPNTQGVEKKGVTSNETHWREVYIYNASKAPKGTVDASYIYAVYDDVDGDQSSIFNTIIDSIELKDQHPTDMMPRIP